MKPDPFIDEIKRFYRDIAPGMLAAFGRTPDNAGLQLVPGVSPRCGYCHHFLSPTIRDILRILAGRNIPPINESDFIKELAESTPFSYEQWKIGILHLEGGHVGNCPRLKDYDYLGLN